MGISIGPSGAPSTPAAWYYNNDEATYGINGNKYGLLYNWNAVKYLNDNRSILIPGWHVPSAAEWDALATAVGGSGVAGTKLKSTTGWRSGAGSDDFWFSAFPSGYRYTGGSFGNIGTDAIFWTATEDSSSNACAIAFDPNAAMTSSYRSNASGSAVRLVKDT